MPPPAARKPGGPAPRKPNLGSAPRPGGAPAGAPRQPAGAAGAATAAAAPRPPPPAQLDRQYSMASTKTVETLTTLQLQVVQIQNACEEAEGMLASTPFDGLPVGMRNRLAQLHGDANSLLATKIDAILTSELNSGKADARAMRKQLIVTVEALIEKLEALVKRFDQLKAAAPAAPKA